MESISIASIRVIHVSCVDCEIPSIVVIFKGVYIHRKHKHLGSDDRGKLYHDDEYKEYQA